MGSNKEARMVVPQLSEDVLMEILSRLRVKDLIRFKSACKTWLWLISSEYFIQLHLKKSSFRIIRPTRRCPMACTSVLPHGAVYNWINMGFLGSCDGLVCLYNQKHGIIHIWNPALHKKQCIAINRPSHIVLCYWFGHSSEDDEYKLILGTTSHMHLVRLYIDNDSWKSTLEVKKNYNYFEDIGTLVNDTVHWPAYEPSLDSTSVSTIVSYNLGNETIGEISAPKTVNSMVLVLGEVDGYLSAMFRNGKYFELWAMKEHGVQESWTKLMILPLGAAMHNRRADRYDDERELILDDPARVKSPLYGKIMYVESLVSPRSRDRAIGRDSSTQRCAETQ